MLQIHTIQDFQRLAPQQQLELQKAIKTKGRLEEWLRQKNKKRQSSANGHSNGFHGEWVRCKSCMDAPGWVWHKDRDPRDIHPSGITECLKALWFACHPQFYLSAEKDIDPRLQMIFDIGHAWHGVIQGYGKGGAWGDPQFYRPEVEIDPDLRMDEGEYGEFVQPVANQYRIRGHVDAVLDNYEIKGIPGLGDVSVRLVHEYKTINTGQYSKLTKPKFQHKWQATIYAAVFNVPVVVYVYTNKDNCQMMDFPLPFDQGIWSEIATKIQKVLHYRYTDQMPPWNETYAGDPSKRHECADCPFKKVCNPPL